MDLGVYYIDEKSWVTIAKFVAIKRKPRLFWTCVFFSRKRKARQPLPKLVLTKKKVSLLGL